MIKLPAPGTEAHDALDFSFKLALSTRDQANYVELFKPPALAMRSALRLLVQESAARSCTYFVVDRDVLKLVEYTREGDGLKEGRVLHVFGTAADLPPAK